MVGNIAPICLIRIPIVVIVVIVIERRVPPLEDAEGV